MFNSNDSSRSCRRVNRLIVRNHFCTSAFFGAQLSGSIKNKIKKKLLEEYKDVYSRLYLSEIVFLNDFECLTNFALIVHKTKKREKRSLQVFTIKCICSEINSA